MPYLSTLKLSAFATFALSYMYMSEALTYKYI
jgi:hypothetical protein